MPFTTSVDYTHLYNHAMTSAAHHSRPDSWCIPMLADDGTTSKVPNQPPAILH